jgi:hypothetical protein
MILNAAFLCAFVPLCLGVSVFSITLLLGLLFELVFFPPDIADGAGPPTLRPMSKVGHGVIGAAAQTFGLRQVLEILHFAFRHSKDSFNKDRIYQ